MMAFPKINISDGTALHISKRGRGLSHVEDHLIKKLPIFLI